MSVIDKFYIKGKTALVTGGSVGLGAQSAEALAEAGANVVIAARKVERCIDMCKRLEKLGVKAFPVACDVSKAEDCQNLVDETVREFKTLDILVNNAGISWIQDSMEMPIDKWEKVIKLNLTGTFQLSVMSGRVMRDQGGGKIINMASIGGFGGDIPENVDSVAYTSSKGGMLTLTRDLAVKWAPYGILVNAICPGWFPTSLNRELLESMKEKLIPRIPLARYGNDEDLKGLVVFLASSASDYITGQFFVIDGGQTARV